MTTYVAGRNWHTVSSDPRRRGDVIAEAESMPDLQRLIDIGVLEESPVGHWVYVATDKWDNHDHSKPGDVIDYIDDVNLLLVLTRAKLLERVDSATFEQPKPKRGRPPGSKNRPKK
jgi:hypothetical protein